MQFKFANGVRVGQQNDLKWLPLLPGCGTQHPHRALGGTCVLLAAAPTTPPCFRRWRRSSSLLAMFSGKIIFNFAFAERSAAMKAPVGLLSGRAVCVSRWRGFAPTSSAERSKRYFHGRGRKGKRHLQCRFLRKRGVAGGRLLPLGGAVAQRLRGFESAEPEKTVKRSSRRTGVNLQFFPVEPSSLGLKGASSPFFVAPARRNRWWFSGSLLVSKENIPRLPPPTPQRCNCRFFSTLPVKNQPESSAELPG